MVNIHLLHVSWSICQIFDKKGFCQKHIKSRGFNSAYICFINYSINDIASDSNCDNGNGDDYDDDGDDIVGVHGGERW